MRLPRGTVAFRDPDVLRVHLTRLRNAAVREVGNSREGRPVFGYTFGNGPRAVSVIAGAHADEPTGPMTAQVLPSLLEATAPDLLDAFRFHIVPQVNPDGHERNRPWFDKQPRLISYLRHAVREAPGDDIEFGYDDTASARPECRAALNFLRPAAPFAAHFSLHGMGFAEGAWFLLCKAWADRADFLLHALRDTCAAIGFPLHDIDRRGEKGFYRLGPGTCTTPTSEGMRAHFLAEGEPASAARFLPSSMEAVARWGGDPLCMVSELPLFLLRPEQSSLADPAIVRFQADRRALDVGDENAIRRLQRRYRIRPVPYALQVRLQMAMMVAALRFLRDREPTP